MGVHTYVRSIIAIHGINGSSQKTWTDKSSGRLWLRDFLPAAIPTARIMVFGYNSAVAFSKSVSGLDGFARELLNALRLMRGSNEVHLLPYNLWNP